MHTSVLPLGRAQMGHGHLTVPIAIPLQGAPAGNCGPAAAPCRHPFPNTSVRDILGLPAETANAMSNCKGMFVSLAPLGQDGAGPGSVLGTQQMPVLLPGALQSCSELGLTLPQPCCWLGPAVSPCSLLIRLLQAQLALAAATGAVAELCVLQHPAVVCGTAPPGPRSWCPALLRSLRPHPKTTLPREQSLRREGWKGA